MWAALNEEHGSEARDRERETAEARDAKNAQFYEQAIRYQQKNMKNEAKAIYKDLLKNHENGILELSNRLEYLCAKNVASMEFDEKDYDAACLHFAKALELDTTDVVVWYQIGKAALETGKFWFARKMLEEGAKVDAKYWPLMQTLCEVLYHIGDIEEFRRLSDYVLKHDPFCTQLIYLNDLLDNEKHTPRIPSTVVKRARDQMVHLETISSEVNKRRKTQIQENLSDLLRHTYTLGNNTSWQNLGKFLLEIFDDLSVVRRVKNLSTPIRFVLEPTEMVEDEKGEENKLKEEQAVLNENSTAACVIIDVDKEESVAAAKFSSPTVASSIKKQVATGTSSTKNSPQITRRKSRRHEEKLREEHEAAVKRAREKDIKHQLERFLEPEIHDVESTNKQKSIEKKDPLGICHSAVEVELVQESKFLVKLEWSGKHEEYVVPCILSTQDLSDTAMQHPLISQETPSPEVHPTQISFKEVEDFVNDVNKSNGGIFDVLVRYLNQCGIWYMYDLSDQSTKQKEKQSKSIASVCFWIEKIIQNRLNEQPFPNRSRSFSMVSANIQELMQVQGLILEARIFMLEIKLAEILRPTHEDSSIDTSPLRTPGKMSQRKMQRQELNIQKRQQKKIAKLRSYAEKILLDLVLADDEMSSPTKGDENTLHLARILWLLAKSNEILKQVQQAKQYYTKCTEALQGQCVFLPNIDDGEVLSDMAIMKKLQGLAIDEVCFEARDLYMREEYDQVEKWLLGHFYASKQEEKKNDISLNLRSLFEDFVPNTEPSSNNNPSNNLCLFEILLDSMKQNDLDHLMEHRNKRLMLLLVTLYSLLQEIGRLIQVLQGKSSKVVDVTVRDVAPNLFKETTQINAHNSILLQKYLRATENILRELMVESLSGKSETAESEEAIEVGEGDEVQQKQLFVLVQACCLKCLSLPVLLLFSSPKQVFDRVLRIILSKSMKSGIQHVILQTCAKLFIQIRHASPDYFKRTFEIVVWDPKPRKERVRSLTNSLLQSINLFILPRVLASSLPESFFSWQQMDMLLRTLSVFAKEEELLLQELTNTTRNASSVSVAASDLGSKQPETADLISVIGSPPVTPPGGNAKSSILSLSKRLFMNILISFLGLFWLQYPTTDIRKLGRLVNLLHKRLGNHGLCGIKLALTLRNMNEDQQNTTSFVQIAAQLLNSCSRKKQHGNSKCVNMSPSRSEDSDSGDEEEEEETLQTRVIAQCYHCMYHVNILSGCEDHHTKALSLPKQSEISSSEDANGLLLLRLLEFALPILLDKNHKKTHGMAVKKDNFQLLSTLEKAILPVFLTRLFPVERSSTQIQSYMNPHAFLQPQVIVDDSTSTTKKQEFEESDCNTPLQLEKRWRASVCDLWYLLAENMVLPKVKRRANTQDFEDLITFEMKSKELLGYLTKDLSLLRSRRFDSWVLAARTLRELYQVVVDHAAIALGTSYRPELLIKYLQPFQIQDTNGVDDSNNNLICFKTIVQDNSFFKSLKSWYLAEGSAARKQIRVPLEKNAEVFTSTSVELESVELEGADPTSSLELTMPEYSAAYSALLLELSRRCLQRAAEIAKQSFHELDGSTLENVKDEREEWLQDLVECHEEIGLLLYNVLQELSSLKRPQEGYKTLVDETLKVFKQALGWCSQWEVLIKENSVKNNETEMPEAKFRLNYMMGKTLRKRNWICERESSISEAADETIRLQSITASKEILGYFKNADKERIDGDMDAMVHAFAGIQGMRLKLLPIPDSPNRYEQEPCVEGLTLALEYFYDHEISESKAQKQQISDDDSNPNSVSTADTSNSEVKNMIGNLMTEGKLWEASGMLLQNVILALRSIYDEDRYFHPARYLEALAIYRLGLYQLRFSQFNTLLPDVMGGVDEGLKALKPLFDKKRAQIVAIWFSESVPAHKRFEEVNQRQHKYDYHRKKYVKLYLKFLLEKEDYGKINELGAWVLACKEEHEAIDHLLLLVLEARGKILESRTKEHLITVASTIISSVTQETGREEAQVEDLTDCIDLTKNQEKEQDDSVNGDAAEALVKHLARVYAFYLDCVENSSRLYSAEETILQQAEYWLVLCYLKGKLNYANVFELPEESEDPDENAHETLTVEMRKVVEDAIIGICKVPDDEELNSANRVSIAAIMNDDNQIETPTGWKAFIEKSRHYCETKWPERMGKGKVTKGRMRVEK